MVYIDDFNTIEKVRITDSQSHITTQKRKIFVHALKSEKQFGVVKTLAEDLNMKVNSKKTQVLCINANSDSKVTSYINTAEGRINSGDYLKILGFHFSSAPNAIHHVTITIDKFYRKLWTLRFLKKSGMSSNDLLTVYKTVILSSVEYCCEIYDSLIPLYLSDRLESVQKQSMKIIFGWGVNYQDLLEEGIIEPLATRRRKACIRFANKAASSMRFGSRWFPRNQTEREARSSTRRIYQGKNNRTERARNNPLQHMIRLLNKQSSD